MAIISISNMEFYAYHGCFAEEQAIGTHFRVNLRLWANTQQAEQSDDINDTVNYLEVYQVVKREMETPSHLLEHVAHRIGTAVKDAFAAIEQVEVTVEKLNPPLGGQMESVSVQLTL